MRKIFGALLLTVLLAFADQAVAQKQYAYVGRQTASLTSATTVAITPKATLTVYSLTADTTVTINATTTYAVPGDVIALKITASGANRPIIFGTNLNALTDTITSGKTKMYQLMWTGAAYNLISSAATD